MHNSHYQTAHQSAHQSAWARQMRWNRSGSLSVGLLAALCYTLSGCKGDPTASPIVDDEARLLWAVTLNHEVANMSTHAPWNTLQLSATPRNPSGEPIDGLPVITFSSNDPALEVTPAGLVTAHGATSRGQVVARLTAGTITRMDTVFIYAADNPSPPQLGSLSISRARGDTIRAYLNENLVIYPDSRRISTTVMATNNTPIFGLRLRYRSADPTIALVDDFGNVYPRRMGRTTLFVETTAYGVTKRDSIPCVIGDPLQVFVFVRGRTLTGGTRQAWFDPDTITIQRGGVVVWQHETADSTDVVFDDPSVASAISPGSMIALSYGVPANESGNIGTFGKAPNAPSWISVRRGRVFLTPGVYRYRSTRYGVSGTIKVR